MHDFGPVLILGVIFWGIVAIVRELSNGRIRQRIVEKGMNNVNAQNLFSQESRLGKHASFKWGLLLTAVGAVLLISQFVPVEVSDEVTFGAMFLTAGICLLVYHFIAPKNEQRPEERKTGR
jgi:hypothetical protein